MLLEYEWGNPAAAAAAMLLFGEESGPEQQQQQVLQDHHYVNTFGMDFFQQPQTVSAAALFPNLSLVASCHHRYGLALPPLPPAMIGLNLGERTYFSLASPKEEMVVPLRVCRRRTRTARCQADGCGADLTHAKHYHRRHKVCEFHSKASTVMAAGLYQRFCQQCSRFHVLSEFDQGKRSCRKRLAEHNRRRRKSQDLLAPSTAIVKSDNNTAHTTTTNNNNNNNNSMDLDRALIPARKHGTSPTVTHKSSSPSAPPSLVVSPMEPACRDGVVPTVTVLSASSSTKILPPPSLLPGAVGRFSSHENHFTNWNEGGDEISSIKMIYDQNN